MATYYVYHGGSGTGTSWATAYTTLTLAFSGHAAGDTYYVAHDHAENTAGAVTLTSLGTLAAPTNVICVNRAGSVPPVSADLRTTATVSTNGAFNLGIGAGSTYWYGITFRSGPGTSVNASLNVMSSGSNQYVRFDSCGLTLNNSGATSKLSLCASSPNLGNQIICRNCTFTFGSNTAHGFTSAGTAAVTIIGGSVAVGASVPATLFVSVPTSLFLIGVDLSAIGSGNTLIGAATSTAMTLMQDCKLGSGVTVAATATSPAQTTYLVRSDSGDTNYRQEKHDNTGSLTTETTIVRTGGASDGTTPIAWKIVTTASPKWVQTFECPPRVIWNDTTGSKTVTIYGVWGGGAVPLNDDIWFDVAYLGTSGLPLASVATTTKANILTAGSNTTSDSSTWGGSTTKFKMSATVTVNEKGPLMVIVKAAKVSSTFYIDPKIEVT